MDTYIYQAALYCGDCGEKIQAALDAAGKRPGSRKPYVLKSTRGRGAYECVTCHDKLTSSRAAVNHQCAPLPLDESTYDSDDYPKGPFADGGGESDSPQHCDDCRVFLENPLTREGYEYTRDCIAEAPTNDAVKEWAVFYDIAEGTVTP